MSTLRQYTKCHAFWIDGNTLSYEHISVDCKCDARRRTRFFVDLNQFASFHLGDEEQYGYPKTHKFPLVLSGTHPTHNIIIKFSTAAMADQELSTIIKIRHYQKNILAPRLDMDKSVSLAEPEQSSIHSSPSLVRAREVPRGPSISSTPASTPRIHPAPIEI